MAVQIDEIDKKILKLLSSDARIPFLEIARNCGISGAAIHQRVSKLEDSGLIKGSCYLMNETALGYTTCAYVGVHFEKGGVYRSVLEELKKIKEIVECHYTTGNLGLLMKIYAKDNSHLMQILSNQVQQISGVASTETFISLEQPILRQVSIE
ncbi:MAG: Lrp/AsnC ligand binding domain-containing protein [Bacteroidales bacterium]|nr:Lrp/AsnC ligand binding domain-containing protein [Bacteroidales bacterium]